VNQGNCGCAISKEIFQLINQCREMWADPPAWQRHLLQGACRFSGMAVGSYIEQQLTPRPQIDAVSRHGRLRLARRFGPQSLHAPL
jgi:hypothetical protein